MRTYSLFQFLSEPISQILDNEDDYHFTVLNNDQIVQNDTVDAIDRINVPIIQRDYVQGLKDNEELLKGFLGDLFKSLESETELKLDFIYGSLDKNDGNVFLPLDGQQRLTTLYLLHWYIIKKEASKKEFESKYANILNKFSYETRDTSRRFFQELVAFNFTDNPKVSIEKSYWYNDHFSLDPTVKACLNALETIHKIYLESPKKGNLLDKLNRNYIVFYILPMDQFRLTDELYIKLNARGKVLSPFENLKADIIGFLKTEKEFDKDILYKDISFKKYDVLGNKFDNDWSNLFWKKAKNDTVEKKSVDSYFFRFIHRMLINNYIIDYKGSNINSDSTYVDLKNREDNLKYFNFDLYQNKNLINTKTINELEVLLDFYHLNYHKFSNLFFPHKNSHAGWTLFKDEFTMDDRIIFDSVNQFILHNSKSDFDENVFQDWMRVVWNLISDPDNRSIEANKTVMNVVRGVAKYSGTILFSLANNELDAYVESLNNIYKLQLEEEKLKAKLILNEDDGLQWKEIITKAESHHLFEGNIGFLLREITSPNHLDQRFNLVVKILNENVGKDNFSLTKYILSQIDDWKVLENFNFLQSEINWKTNLRRTEIVKSTIIKLIDSGSFNNIQNKIDNSIKLDSILIEVNTKQKTAHKNLYKDADFHIWMQNDDVHKLKWREHRLYIIRPSAWYSKVMIDGFRNNLINKLNQRWTFDEITNRCGKSDFFMLEKFDYFKTFDEKKITFHFDLENKLHIGLRVDLNPTIESLNPQTDGWIECHSFDIDDIKSSDEIDDFITNIENNIQSNEDSFIRNLLMTNSNFVSLN